MEVGDETDFLRGYVGYSGGGGASRHAFDLEVLGPRRLDVSHVRHRTGEYLYSPRYE